MSKVLTIPDSHLKIDVIENGIELANKFRADKIIMLGDYFDDWFALTADYVKMLGYIKNLLRKDTRVIPLLGNHELSYLGYPCSGYNKTIAPSIYDALIKDYRFCFCYAVDGVVYSHAGVCVQWLWENNICTANDMRYKLSKKNGTEVVERGVDKIDNFPRSIEKLKPFSHAGPARGGSTYPSLLWADLTELIADPAPFKQVVGHTPVKEITNIGRVWFTDVFSNNNESDEYLLISDGEPRVIHYKEVL